MPAGTSSGARLTIHFYSPEIKCATRVGQRARKTESMVVPRLGIDVLWRASTAILCARLLPHARAHCPRRALALLTVRSIRSSDQPVPARHMPVEVGHHVIAHGGHLHLIASRGTCGMSRSLKVGHLVIARQLVVGPFEVFLQLRQLAKGLVQGGELGERLEW